MTRISSGLERLDSILGGGLPHKSAVLLSGGPGTGKTLFGMNFLMEGTKNKEKCCYISLNENKEEVIRACKGIKSLSDIDNFLDKNLVIEHIKLGENITMKRFIEIVSSYPRIDRLVIDNVNKLLIFNKENYSYRVYMADLLRQVKAISGCTLLLCETNSNSIDTGNGEAFECDGVINLDFLDFEEKPLRILSVHKMRYAHFEPKVPHNYIISPEGIKLGTMKII